MNVRMLLKYSLLLTLIPITQQYCGVANCVFCQNRTCCLQCESGCLCTSCDLFRSGCEEGAVLKPEVYIIGLVTLILLFGVLVCCYKHCCTKRSENEDLADNTARQGHLSHNTNVTRSADNDRITERRINAAESGYHGAEASNHGAEVRYHRAEASAPPLAIITLQGSSSRYESAPATVSEQSPPSYDSLFMNR